MSPTHTQRLLAAYRTMVLIRQFDHKAINLQRTGQLGTYASCLGAEAFGVAAGMSLKQGDRYVPYYRDHAALYLRGVPLENLLLYWGGDERGNVFPTASDAALDLPYCVPIATQLTQAAGVASALKLRHQQAAVLVTCGDGATSRGDFHETLNVATVWQLPLVVLINNNQWAISVPLRLQTASPSLAARADGYGMPGKQVDGNDVEALLAALEEALERARHGKGPSLIEAISYRLGDHTTADDASRYRPAEELHQAWEREPVGRLRQKLMDDGCWDAEQEKQLLSDCDAEVEAIVKRYLDTPPAAATELIDHLYAELPASLLPQRERLVAQARQGGEHG